jgi:hypothetical protein
MKAMFFACASGAALLFGVVAIAGESAPAEAAAVETPSEGAPVQELTDPTAAAEPTVEGEVAPEGEGDIDADAEAEPTVEGEVAPEGEGDIDADAAAAADAEAPAEAPADAAAPEAAEEPSF